MQTVGLVDEDDEQNEFLDENVDEEKRDGLKVSHGADDLERGGDESHEDVDDGHEHHQTQRAVDQLDQPAGQGVIPAPLLQPHVEDPGGVERGEFLGLVQVSDLLVESLEHQGDDPGQHAEEEIDAHGRRPGDVGQHDGQRPHHAHVPVGRLDRDKDVDDAILYIIIIK